MNLGILTKFLKITLGVDNKRKTCSLEIQINKIKKIKTVSFLHPRGDHHSYLHEVLRGSVFSRHTLILTLTFLKKN